MFHGIADASHILYSLLLSQDTGDFLIRANTKKRQKVQDFNNSSVVDHVEVVTFSLVIFFLFVSYLVHVSLK